MNASNIFFLTDIIWNYLHNVEAFYYWLKPNRDLISLYSKDELFLFLDGSL